MMSLMEEMEILEKFRKKRGKIEFDEKELEVIKEADKKELEEKDAGTE